MIFKEKSKEKVLYTKNERTIYDEYDRGYVLNWLVMKSNEFEMEPLILSLKPGASYKHFDPSESDTFIYCLKGCVTLTLGNSRYQANEQDVLYFRANEIHQLHNETTDEIEILIVATKIIFIKGSIVMEPLLSFKGVTKGFDDVTILNKMDLEIESGHFILY